ncbi:tRNA-specific 2-thiouridylase MnmA [Phycisphaerae bacterium]|nr:tRNA-specific 2-thiouridylase MnmA [Phycisphaerae bacterium]
MSIAKAKVLVAMSGGVDSSVAAALLQREGYEVVGCFMRLGSPGETLDELMPYDDACAISNADDQAGSHGSPARTIKIGHQGCCSINDAADARLVAAQLGISFYVCNFKKDFGRIIDYFVDEYANGRTPNPCVRCNDWLKFGKLHEYAKQIGADFVASGHYARIERDAAGSPRLYRGVDHSKDQSYVLFGAPRERLAEMLLPIGGLEKTHVRELARQFNLPVFDKPDSQEICFVPDNDYAGLVERKRPELAASHASTGKIIDRDGTVVGEHEGQHHFTIGQRRGLNVALGYRIYVTGKDAKTNTVTIGSEDDLKSTSCIVGEANWLIDVPPLDTPRRVHAKYRYNSPAVPATIHVLPDATSAATPSGRSGMFAVTFDTPQTAVAPGQAVVLFDEANPDWIIAGGWIAQAVK